MSFALLWLTYNFFREGMIFPIYFFHPLLFGRQTHFFQYMSKSSSMKTCTCMAFIRIISGISRLHWQYRLCALKLKTIHKCFLCPYKRQISVLRLTALRGVRAHKNVAHFQHKLNVIYSDRCCVVELLLQLKSKQQSMPNNVETQPKHMYSLYIGS